MTPNPISTVKTTNYNTTHTNNTNIHFQKYKLFEHFEFHIFKQNKFTNNISSTNRLW